MASKLTPGVGDMRHDLAQYLPEMSVRDKVGTWLRYYFGPTHFWLEPLLRRWDLWRYGPLPPIEKDRVAHHFGFVEGVPGCTDGPLCAAHGWKPSPLMTEEA